MGHPTLQTMLCKIEMLFARARQERVLRNLMAGGPANLRARSPGYATRPTAARRADCHGLMDQAIERAKGE